VRIGAMVEKRWGSKKDLQDNREESENEEDRDKEERSEDGPGESQEKVEEKILLSIFC